MYDISKPCEGGPSDLCYPQTQSAYCLLACAKSLPSSSPYFRFIRNYLDDPSVRTLIGVDSSITKNFTSCSSDVGQAFGATQDILHPTADYVAALLERGVRVLIYVVSLSIVSFPYG